MSRRSRKMVKREIASVPGRKWLHLTPGHCFFTISVIFTYLPSLIQGVPQTNIAGLVGQIVDLPCVVDSAKCGELHSIKWYRGSSRIFVFSESANIAKSEGDYTDRAELQYDHNETRSSLRIKPVHVSDEALYKCEITYIEVREGCSVVQFINLTTQIKPEYLRISRADGSELQNSSLIGPFSEGDRLSLLCESGGGKPVPKVEWKNGSNVINGDYQVDADSNGVGTGRNKIKLTIGRGDLGAKYECNAQNDALEIPLISWVELDVNVRPLKMVLSGVEHHVVQGTKVLLQCIVYGARPAANITWFNGTELMREDLVSTTSAVKQPKTKIILTADGTYETQSNLVFTASRFENGGTLTCEAINSVMIDRDEPPMKSALVLEVLYPPIVAVSPENITVNESTDILLFCSYEANPTLLKSVKWMRDGIEVELNPEHFTGGTTEEPTLLIKNSTRYDQGVYTCILENEVGATESSNAVYVNISYKPTVKVVMNPPSPVSELDKLNVTLICQVESGNPDILQVVRWYLDGSLLKELPECSPGNDTLCDIDPSRLLLEVVGRSFHGNYSCEGMNDAGWGPLSENSELVVYYPPGPATLVYEPKRVVKKSSVRLMCSVSDLGRPPSNTFRWVRGTHLIQDVTSANWTIDPVTLETEANFTCSAYNLGGEGDSASVYIEVFAPPAFIERLPPYHGALMSAQHISVSCRVECSPLCTVTWLKNGRPLDSTPGASLLYSVKNTVIPADPRTNDFKSVQSTLLWNMSAWPGGQLDRIHDNANYTCQSTGNSVGSGVKSTTIFGVEYPPENITLSNKVISVVEGHVPEKVLCSAKAYPEASYHWRKEGETETIIKGNALILNYPVPRRNGGNYVCEAYNRHGNVSGKTYLNVLFKPECGITQTETNGKPVLICTAHANPKEVDFTWKIKNENETVEDSIENQGLQSFLTLESRIENFRTYLCFANNSVGMSIPCERDVTGKAAWWPMFENDNLVIIVAVVIGAILMFLVICVIIIIVCRRKRADDKYNKPMELEERENYESYERFILNLYGPDVRNPPEGNSASPVVVQQPVQPPQPKWPLKPGVLVHVNNARFSQGLGLSMASSLSSLPKTSTPNKPNVGSSNPTRSRSNKKLWNVQRRRAISLGSLAQADDTSQRSRANRIRKMFSHERLDSLPTGFYQGKSGVVTFRKVDDSRLPGTTSSRKRKKPGDCPNQSATADKLGLDPRGSQSDGLDERAFYENLPFHGMQNPPTKSGLTLDNRLQNSRNFQNRSNRSISSEFSSRTEKTQKFNTLRNPRYRTRSEPVFHSLRLEKRDGGEKITRVKTSTILLKDLYPTCTHHCGENKDVTVPVVIASQESNENELANNEENSQKEIENNETKEAKDSFKILDETTTSSLDDSLDTPCVPDRKNKPKFFNGKLKCKSETESELDDTFINNDDNESLISGVERLSISPAPVPAPRKLISNSLSKLSTNNKHTYQNVPIPISPNNSQDVSPNNEKSLEARHYKLTSSQQHLLPLNNKKNAQQATYNLLQHQGKPRHCGRSRKYDTNSMRDSSRKYNDYLDSQNMNGSLRQNQLFFNSLRDADRQLTNNGIRDSEFKNKIKTEIKSNKEFREKTKERLKDSTPLQVMRFKDLLTAGGENYNRQSNSDSSGERRFNTDSSSGDTEMAISDSRHFKNISSGEESLLRDGSRSSYRGVVGDLEIYRPVPVNNSAVREHRNHTNSLERTGRSLDRKESDRTYVPPSTLPIQSFYTPMGSDPLLLPHYAPLGSDLTPNSEPHLPPMFTPGESDATPGGSDLTPLGSDPFVRDSVVYADLAHAAAVANERARVAQLRNNGSVGGDPKRNSEYASLKFHDVGQEIDV